MSVKLQTLKVKLYSKLTFTKQYKQYMTINDEQ